MLRGESPIEQEYLTNIKRAERQRNLFPFAASAILIFFLWRSGTGFFQWPTQDRVFSWIIFVVLIVIGTEVMNLKVYMHKAEYREWLRDFRPDAWRSLGSDD